jgi:hypothetical protein
MKQRQAVEPRHHHVRQHEVRRPHPRQAEGGVAVGCGLHLVTFRQQQARHVLAHVGAVVGQQHARLCGVGRRGLDRRGDELHGPQPARGFLEEHGATVVAGFARVGLAHAVGRQVRGAEGQTDGEGRACPQPALD